MLNKNKWGFTLIELLVTIAVLGILASATYVGAGEVRKTIRDNKRRADLNEVARALELFKADYGQYPSYNYYSTSYWDDGKEDVLMPFLTDGANMVFSYPGGFQTKTVSKGYMKNKVADPINSVNNNWEGYMYVYWGSQWGNWALHVADWADSEWFNVAEAFPMYCPEPNEGNEECGNGSWTMEQNWNDCCNAPGCFNNYCDYDVASESLTFISSYSMNGWSSMCYGDGTTRSVAILMARLERPSKSEERLDNVLAFCPTADPAHPNHNDFLRLKKIFPRTKDCYDGNPDNWDPDGGIICEDEDPPHSSFGWNGFPLDEYNYIVPLTGEFNLR